MGEQHLDLLALSAGRHERVDLSSLARQVARTLVDTPRHLSRRAVGAASWFQRVGPSVECSGSIQQGGVVIDQRAARGQQLRKKSSDSFQDVLAAAADTLLAGFAAGLGRDHAAVQAALDLPWTTSPVEGQVNRIKTIKRSMYGRAGFDLFRTRVLHAA